MKSRKRWESMEIQFNNFIQIFFILTISAACECAELSIVTIPPFSYSPLPSSPPRPHEGVSETLMNFKDETIYGIAGVKGMLAVVIKNGIKIYKQNSIGRLQEEHSLIVMENRTFDRAENRLLEFKFDNDYLLFCTQLYCRICNVTKQTCSREYSIKPTERFNRSLFFMDKFEYVLKPNNFDDIKELKGEIVGSVGDRLILRSVNEKGAQVYQLDTSPSVMNITNIGIDFPRHGFGFHRLATSFSDDSYTYFVGSAKRTFMPYNVAYKNFKFDKPFVMRTDIRVTRVCNADKTLEFQSRMDIALPCGQFGFDEYKFEDGWNHTVITATFSSSTQKLYVLFERSNMEKKIAPENFLCEYLKKDIEQTFDGTWDECQSHRSKTTKQMINDCEYNGNDHILNKYCFITSWFMTTHKMNEVGWICKAYNADLQKLRPEEYRLLGNCNLSESKSAIDQYSWLENYKPDVNGTLIGSIDKTYANVLSMTHIQDRNFAFTFSDGSTQIYKNVSNIKLAPIWTFEKTAKNQFSTHYHDASNSFIFVRNSTIERFFLNCFYLYNECNNSLLTDPGCVWCAYSNATGLALEIGNKSFCEITGGKSLDGICPPEIAKFERKDRDGEFTLIMHEKIKDLRVKVCTDECEAAHVPGYFSVKCPFGSKRVGQCMLEITGDYGNLTDYTMIFNVSKFFDEAEKGAVTRNERYLATIGVILFLSVLLIFIWYLYIKFAKKFLANDDLGYVEKFRERLIKEHYSTDPRFADDRNYTDRMYPLTSRVLGKSEINRFDIEIIQLIGNGSTSSVYLGMFTGNGHKSKEVAVKTIHYLLNLADVEREICLISKCRHKNIVEFIGYYQNPHGGIDIVTEYMKGGDLHQYLINDSNTITLGDAFNYLFNILDGMEYLTSQHIIHRDLAARNCMLNMDYSIVKITDFGLGRQSDNYYQYVCKNNDRPLPFRWLAIESFDSNLFSEKSDVWSFGVVCWEIFARNRIPYEGKSSLREVKEFISDGGRLEPIDSQTCPEELYKIMRKCWDDDLQERPSFSELKEEIYDIYRAVLRNSLGGYEIPAGFINNSSDTISGGDTNEEVLSNDYTETTPV